MTEGRQTILVVDDEPGVLRSVARHLDQLGYVAYAAYGAVDALEVLARRAGKVDVLLCDVDLPGVLGPTLVSIVRRLYPHVRVLYMSGHASRRSLDTSKVAVLYKPFDVDVLGEGIRRVLADGVAPSADEKPPEA